MANITLQAHFDGEQILLDEPFELSLNDKLLIRKSIHLSPKIGLQLQKVA